MYLMEGRGRALDGAERGRQELHYDDGQWGSEEDGSGRMNADVACGGGGHQQVDAGQGKQGWVLAGRHLFAQRKRLGVGGNGSVGRQREVKQ
jgi:hypothetical protein